MQSSKFDTEIASKLHGCFEASFVYGNICKLIPPYGPGGPEPFWDRIGDGVV
jgi:hypothetical protein